MVDDKNRVSKQKNNNNNKKNPESTRHKGRNKAGTVDTTGTE